MAFQKKVLGKQLMSLSMCVLPSEFKFSRAEAALPLLFVAHCLFAQGVWQVMFIVVDGGRMLALTRCLNQCPFSKRTFPQTRTVSHMASETSRAVRILSSQGQRRVSRHLVYRISEVQLPPTKTVS